MSPKKLSIKPISGKDLFRNPEIRCGIFFIILSIVVFFLSFIFGIPWEDWFIAHMPVWLARLNIILFFVFIFIGFSGLLYRISFTWHIFLSFFFLAQVFFIKVSSDIAPQFGGVMLMLFVLSLMIWKIVTRRRGKNGCKE